MSFYHVDKIELELLSG